MPDSRSLLISQQRCWIPLPCKCSNVMLQHNILLEGCFKALFFCFYMILQVSPGQMLDRRKRWVFCSNCVCEGVTSYTASLSLLLIPEGSSLNNRKYLSLLAVFLKVFIYIGRKLNFKLSILFLSNKVLQSHNSNYCFVHSRSE